MKWIYIVSILIVLSVTSSQAQSNIIDVCPDGGIQQRGAEFDVGGIILTAFDSANLWVYDINRDTRYPLPETRPCTSNCHLSPDAQWLIYLNPTTFIFSKMRVNGTQRTALVNNAADVQWWSSDTLLIWSTDHDAYLRPEADPNATPEYLSSRGLRAVQPNGYYAMRVDGDNGIFNRYLVDLANADTEQILLSADRTYFNASSWSPTGEFLAYVGDGLFDESAGILGSELFLINPNDSIPRQMTDFASVYGATRINGYAPGDLSWSPDGNYLAFWVIDLNTSDPASNTGDAVLHLLDVRTGSLSRFCTYTTSEHTPETPRIIWSPDSSHLAFAGNIAGDDKGALLLAVNIETGVFTELSDGMFPAYGIPQLNAWGIIPS